MSKKGKGVVTVTERIITERITEVKGYPKAAELTSKILSDKAVPELKDMVKHYDIEGRSKLTKKDDLVLALLQHAQNEKKQQPIGILSTTVCFFSGMSNHQIFKPSPQRIAKAKKEKLEAQEKFNKKLQGLAASYRELEEKEKALVESESGSTTGFSFKKIDAFISEFKF
jgi:hypothetical protein